MTSRLETKIGQRALLVTVSSGTTVMIIAGRGIPALAFIPLVGGTFLAYVLLIWSLTRQRHLGATTLIAACIVSMMVAIAVPARSSKDVYAYIMYGRIVAHYHASPYTHVPADFPNDPGLKRVQVAFRSTGSVYGPVFTGLSAAGMSACGTSPVCGRIYFQSLEALAVLGAAWLVLIATRSWAAAACVGLNPVLVASIVNGAHNDGLAAIALLAAVILARERPVVAGVLLGAAALVKVNVLLPGAVLVAWLFFRSDKRRAILFAFTSGALVVAGYLLAGGSAALKPLAHTAGFVSQHSFWFATERALTNILSDDWTRARAANFSANLIPVAGLIVVIVLALVVAAGRGRDRGPEPVVAAALAVYVLATPYILPWYAASLIPLLAMRWRSRTTWLLLSYSMLLYLVYPARFPVHRSFTALILPEAARNVLPLVQLAILGAVAFAAWRPRGKERGGGPSACAFDRIWATVVNG